jgi:fumarate reductase subunit D
LMAAILLAPFGLIQHGTAAERLLNMQSLFSLDGLVLVIVAMPLWLKPIMLLFLTWAMVFRGLLFAALASGTARKRPWP